MKRANKEAVTIAKYLFSAGSAFVLDLLLFTLFRQMLVAAHGSFAVIYATIAARILSSLYNYFVNSRFVFGHRSGASFLQYYLLVVTQMACSAGFVYLLASAYPSVSPSLIKAIVDTIIFVVNYLVQRFFIFRRK